MVSARLNLIFYLYIAECIMATLSPYLNFNGNTEEAFNFYKSVFGGEFATLQRFKDVPGLPGTENMSEEDGQKIMHVSLPIGNGVSLMASDSMESFGHSLTVGNNFYISINADSEAEAGELFTKLSGGGNVQMEMQKTFWGAYFGMCTDQFGIQWMINYDYNQQ